MMCFDRLSGDHWLLKFAVFAADVIAGVGSQDPEDGSGYSMSHSKENTLRIPMLVKT